MCGFAGAFMSMAYVSWFARDMLAGRGFISMSATNIADASPILTMLCAMMFGLSQAVANAMQITAAPAELISAFPYVATIVFVFAFSIIKSLKKKRIRKKMIESLEIGK